MSKQKNRPKFVEAVPVRDFYNSFKDPLNLELVAGEGGMDKTIRERSLNRPALAITGYFNYFAAKRIQLLERVKWVICVTLMKNVRYLS